MDMRRLLALLLAALLLTGLFTGCKTDRGAAQTEAPSGTREASASDDPTEPVDEPVDDGIHPMLFHVTGPDGQECWLFGTIHAGDERMDTAMEKLTPYLDGCTALAVEFDVVAYESDMESQMATMWSFLALDGVTAEQKMGPELYARSCDLLREAGVSPEAMQYFNLAWWSQLVSQAALMTRSELDYETGMDRRLINYCYERDIEVRDVESPELRYGLLLSFSDELDLLLIEETLDGLDTYGEELNELYEAWLKGDYDELTALVAGEDEGEEYTPEQIALLEDYNDKMLTQRNLGMRDKAVEWLEAGDRVFFAVGAAHLVGEGGLVELLRAAGYTAEQTDYRSSP